jgi:hypothetical protein
MNTMDYHCYVSSNKLHNYINKVNHITGHEAQKGAEI